MHNAALIVGAYSVTHSILNQRLNRQRRKEKFVALDVIYYVQAVAEVLRLQSEVGFGVLHLLFKGNHFIGTAQRFKMRAQVYEEAE